MCYLGFIMRCVECREGRVLVFLIGIFAVWKIGCFSLCFRYPVLRFDFIWKWWTGSCIWSKDVQTCGFQVAGLVWSWGLCVQVWRIMVCWFCFVACVVWVAEGQFKEGSGHLVINLLKLNDLKKRCTAQLTSRCSILHIYSTNIRTEYFKHTP